MMSCTRECRHEGTQTVTVQRRPCREGTEPPDPGGGRWSNRPLGNVVEVSIVEVTERVEATADRVWDLIRDPTAMAPFTEECVSMRWMGGSSQPAVGARFRGRNRSGWRRWSTACTIIRYQTGREIAWDVAFGPLSVARWGYRLDPGVGKFDPGVGDGATVIRESFEDRRCQALRALGPVVRGTADADGLNRANMLATLARIKVRAET
jgi:hypothetical protein